MVRLFGLKLWSKDFIKNKEFACSAERALKEGKFGYIELFALPDTYDSVKDMVQSAFKGVKTVIHAPHGLQNLNLSDAECFIDNQRKLADSQRFADLLDAAIIILHPGFMTGDHDLEENIRQFQLLNDKRLAVENLPFLCSSTHKNLVGVKPSEIKQIINEAHCQFCLDFSHAICGANSYHSDVYQVLDKFKKLKPNMYHLCDGNITSIDDAHLHYGEGNYDLKRLVCEYTTDDALITMETGHGIPSSVRPWLDDLEYIQKLCC